MNRECCGCRAKTSSIERVMRNFSSAGWYGSVAVDMKTVAGWRMRESLFSSSSAAPSFTST
jgi:hypothetical protein